MVCDPARSAGDCSGGRGAGGRSGVGRTADGPARGRCGAQRPGVDDALAVAAQQVHQARDVAQARTLTPGLRRLAQQLLQGRGADGDGRVTFAAGEPGLQLLQVSVRTRAGTPPPRAGTASPAPSTEVVR